MSTVIRYVVNSQWDLGGLINLSPNIQEVIILMKLTGYITFNITKSRNLFMSS